MFGFLAAPKEDFKPREGLVYLTRYLKEHRGQRSQSPAMWCKEAFLRLLQGRGNE